MSEWTEKDFESYTQSDWELIKTVKQLADENLDNVKILTRANDIALAIFGMLCVRLRDNGEEGADDLGLSLEVVSDVTGLSVEELETLLS